MTNDALAAVMAVTNKRLQELTSALQDVARSNDKLVARSDAYGQKLELLVDQVKNAATNLHDIVEKLPDEV